MVLGGRGGLIRMGMPGFAEQWGRMKHWNTHWTTFRLVGSLSIKTHMRDARQAIALSVAKSHKVPRMFRFQGFDTQYQQCLNNVLCMLDIASCIWHCWSPCQHSGGDFELQDCFGTQNLHTYGGTLVGLTLEEQRKERTTPFGINSMRSQVSYRAAKASDSILRWLCCGSISVWFGCLSSVLNCWVCMTAWLHESACSTSAKPESLGWCTGDIDIVIGGPPCQGVTGLNRHAVRVDIRDDSRYTDCWYNNLCTCIRFHSSAQQASNLQLSAKKTMHEVQQEI